MPGRLDIRVLRQVIVSSDRVGTEHVAAVAAEQASVPLSRFGDSLTNKTSTNDSVQKLADSYRTSSVVETMASKKQHNQHVDQSPRKIKGLLWALCVLAMLSSIFLVALDITVTATLQPAIIRQFDSTGKLAWVSVAFLCASASTSLTWGQIYSRFNVKYVYLLCIAIFETGSTVCGAAPTMDALIAGRAICGLGGAGMYTGVTILLTINTAEHERAQYFGFCGLTWGLGTVLGPLLAGAFDDSSASWRWAFYINLCIGAVFTTILVVLIPNSPATSDTVSVSRRLKSVDWAGFVLLAGFLVSSLMILSFGGTLYVWGSRSMIALYFASGVLAIIFLAQQSILAAQSSLSSYPTTCLLPVAMFRSKINLIMFIASCCAATSLYTSTYFIPLYFQLVRGNNAIEAGVRLLPFIVLSSASGIFSGIVLGRIPYHMPWFAFGPALLVIGGSLFFTVGTHTALANILGYSILLGIGSGCWIQLPFTVVQCRNDPEHARVVTGVLAFAQVAAPAIGLAIANAVFLNVATSKIQHLNLSGNPTRQEIQAMISGVSAQPLTSGDAEVTASIVAAILSALRYPFILVISAGGITLLLCISLRWERTFPKRA